jgi:hypothetical protein
MSVTYDRKSYLRDTAFADFYLDNASLPSISNVEGQYIVVPPECNYRIDLFAYQQYGSSRLWWLIALANADIIKDPIWDFTSGLTVLVPDQTAATAQITSLR